MDSGNKQIKLNQDSRDLFLEEEQMPHRESMELEGGEEGEGEDYYCMTCHEKYNFKISICNHRRKHEVRYKCQFQKCGRRFRLQSGLQRHRLTHTGAKPYQCDYAACEQRFNQKSNLNRHKRIHSQQKPFICEKCCKSFTTTTNLKQHVQVHFQDKQRRRKYICEITGCNKEYLYMCNLRKHKQEHEDPLADCISDRKPENHTFSLDLPLCKFRLAFRKTRDHPQVLITYRNLSGAVNYTNDFFEPVLRAFNADDRIQEEKVAQETVMSQLEDRLENLMERAGASNNVCFQLEEKLNPMANLVVKTLLTLTETKSCKNLTVLVESYEVFKDVVKNLMEEYVPL